MRELSNGRKDAGRTPGAVLALVVLAIALPGCSSISGGSSSASSDPGDKLGAALFGPPAKPTGITSNTPEDFECPGVQVRPGASTLNISGRGADNAALDVRYQGSIVRTSRDCQVRTGNVTIRVGVEGRLVLGPAGGPGQIDVPLRLAVVHEGTNAKTVTTKFYRVSVTVPENEARVTFTHIAEDLTFPMPVPAGDIDSYIVYVGFDPAGMPEPKAKPAPKTAAKKPAPRQPAQPR
ncbi:MAG: hypothetical protein WCI56_05085 [Hyphomicrobiales bacterium]